MSILKNKSELSFKAADVLNTNGLYSSVVHCSYYSCLQLMMHIWLKTMGGTERDITDISRKSKEGSHEILINKIVSFAKYKSLNFRALNNQLTQLKRLRVNADYKEIEIDSSISMRSIKLSTETRNILKRCL